jgi:pilus assembly protein FimV
MEGGDMVRKLSLAIALVMGISPLSSYAVGLGNIHLNSALNQYFDAEIDLLSVDQDEITDIKVNLASPEAFRRSGIDRPFILSKLRFTAEETADGKSVIRVSSRDPIREPFLNFLIEVNWPKGRLVREYTVLLDPPVTLGRRPAPVQQAPMQRTPDSRIAAPAPQTPAPAGRSAVAPSDVTWAGSPAVDEYGPTQRNDTLWGIASQVRTEGASMAQMMIALQRANPQAFINQNINNLKVGQVLRIPRADEVRQLSRREASIAYSEQLQDWQADSQPSEMAAEGAAADQPMGTEQPAEAAPAPSAELKIASARPSGEGEAGANGGAAEGAGEGAGLDQLKQELIASEEAKEAALQEAEAVRSRVEDLESQLEDLQRLLSLKNDQLSRLQAGVAGSADTPEEPPVVSEGADGAADGAPVMAEPEAESAAPAEGETAEADQSPVMEEEPADTVVPEGAPLAGGDEPSPVMEEETPKPEVAAQAPVTETAPQPDPAAQPAPPPAPAEPAEEDGLLAMIGQDTTLLGVAVAGIVVLLALLWVAISRRRSHSADFQESILISTIDESDSEQVMDEIGQEPASHSTEETSFLSDFSPSDIDALQDETGEVDPLAEADVYIAYGRYQQAEELIRQAMDKSPERTELKYKLFEILYATKDKDGFVALAESASAEGLDQRDPAAWDKVVAMGAQLAAAHALFAGAAGSSPDDDELSSLEDELGLDNELDLDLDSTSVDLADQDDDQLESVAALNLDEGSEFSTLDDLADLSLDSELLKANLDEISTDLGFESEGAEPAPAAEEDAEILSLEDEEDFALDADTDLTLVTDRDAVDEDTADGDLTLSELDAEGLLDEESAFAIEDPLESAEMDDLRLDAESEAEQLGDAVLDFSDSLSLEGTDSQMYDSLELGPEDNERPLELDESFSLADLDQEDEGDVQLEGEAGDLTDEINTKLDLARAYVEMEDADGARSILEEVLNEGNDGQQTEARKLLDKIS